MSAIPTSVTVTANTWTEIIAPVSGNKIAMWQQHATNVGYEWRVDTSAPDAGEVAFTCEEYPRRTYTLALSDTHGVYVLAPEAITFAISVETDA